MAKKRNFIITAFLDFFEVVFIGIAVFVIVYIFVGQLMEVNGSSMEPNFQNKEQIIAEKVSLGFKKLQRGEVIIARQPQNPEKLLIKRVIGLPNETIKISQGKVYINEKELDEPYLPKNTTTIEDSTIKEDVIYKIPEESYIIMGDNREDSTDSRSWGAVPKDLIVGRALLVYYPLKEIKFVAKDLF